MNRLKIHQFFKRLDKNLGQKADIIVVGAGAGSLMGHVRPSFDIDFEIRLNQNSPGRKALLAGIITQSARETGVSVNFSENIGGWSMISYLDYRKTADFYKQFGKLKVKIIEPAYWTIGKMTRFLELDIQDMVKIIRKKKIEPQRLIRIWAQAFKSSDLSLELGQFKDHVEHFLKKYARRLWGKEAESGSLIAAFFKQAGIQQKRKLISTKPDSHSTSLRASRPAGKR